MSLRLAAIWLTSVVLAAQPANVDAVLEAARAGDRARVASLLDAGVSVNASTKYGVSALGFAAERGHFDVVTLLVERGADVHVADSFYGSRPVDFALRGGHLEIAAYLIDHGSPGAVSVLNAATRRGDTAIAQRVKAAADATAAATPKPIELPASLLRSYEGAYQNATTGAAVKVIFDGTRLIATSDAQTPLRLQPVEERRFVAEDSPEVIVAFAGRGGIIERLSIARGSSSIRYEREGFADATSPAPDPSANAGRPASAAPAAKDPSPRGVPLPWPSFRGANGSGVADAQGIVASWDVATSANVKWKTPIPGLGTSSPIVWGNRVIVASAASDEDTSFRTGLTGDITPIATLPIHTYRLHALDRATGQIAWQRDVFVGKPITKRHFKSSQANATPATDGRRIVAVFGSIGLLVCYDMDGSLLWKQDIGALDSGWFLDASYQWGHSSSPIIYQSTVIVQADQSRGSFIASFDLATGRQQWRTPRSDEVSTWATPALIAGPKGDELVTNGTKVRGYDPATGAQLWSLAPNSEIAIGTPVVYRDLAIVTAGYPPVRPVYAIKAGARGDISLPAGKTATESIAWSHDRDGTYISSPIVYRDQLYTLNNNGILTAYAAATGERIYRSRVGGGGAFSASPIASDGRLYLASEDGDVFVIQAGREYVELGKYPMHEVIMASPAISDGLLIIRTLGHVWAIGK
jgi:outer membrane protein assembly factor BamB